MEEELKKLKEQSEIDFTKIKTISELKDFEVSYLGRKGKLTLLLKFLPELTRVEKQRLGEIVNEFKAGLEKKIADKGKELRKLEYERIVQTEWVDVTAPGPEIRQGKIHPISKMIDEICKIFHSMGYTIADGPEIEEDYYNFDSLNIPPFHPARDTQDTFWVDPKSVGDRTDILLRTQTSAVQTRFMERHKPPVRIIAPGRVFRNENEDAKHSATFYQVEGLLVDQCINFENLRGTLDIFIKQLLGEEVKTRFRPSYFPFTEPSAEMDVSCTVCGGSGKDSDRQECRTCKGVGWLEIMGCGMVHPKVLENVGYDTKIFTGFAFGVGVDRLVILKYSVPDIRDFYKGDLRFLEQF